MINFPEWSDIGDVSPQTRDSWLEEIAVRDKFISYYDGSIFKETIPLEHGSTEAEPELYPVGINLVKMMCLAQSDSMFGEWENVIVKFEPSPDDEADSADIDAGKLASRILRHSQANTMLWELALDQNIYGGGAIQISPDIYDPGGIKWSRVPLDSFFPIWSPDNPDELLEVFVVIPMTREQARARYQIDIGSKEYGYRVDHWTNGIYEVKIENQRIDAYSGINPWGFVPFEYIPRTRSRVWWGESLTEDLTRVQDELNMRIADLGNAINYNADPIKWGINLPRTFSSKNFPIDSGTMWDLGRHWKDAPKPEVGILEAQNPIPSGTFDYISFLYDWSRTSVFAPPIAFGEDSGGGQRSGVTLEIRMWPLIKVTRRSRSYMGDGLIRAMRKSALILKQKKLGHARALERLIRGDLLPMFAPVMPRDQAKLVDEVVRRFTTTPPTISLETSVKKLGDGIAEVAKIETMLANDKLYKRAAPNAGGPPGMDAGAGLDEQGKSEEGEQS